MCEGHRGKNGRDCDKLREYTVIAQFQPIAAMWEWKPRMTDVLIIQKNLRNPDRRIQYPDFYVKYPELSTLATSYFISNSLSL